MNESVNLYKRQQVYHLDQLAMSEDGYSSKQLMGQAARAVWYHIHSRWPDIKKVVIFAGSGNNGGDAFAIASIMKNKGISVDLIAVGDLSRQSKEAREYRESWEQQGGVTQTWQGDCPPCDLVLDGLLGIGLDRQLDENWISMIEKINSLKTVRVSIDIPSGLNADIGKAMPVAIMAHLTVTFIGRKIGCYIADGADYCGEIAYEKLGLSDASEAKLSAICQLLETHNIRLPEPRKNNSHKNQFGHVLIIGGGQSMSGAARLAAMAALRGGAGLVSLSVHPDNVIAASQQAELMVSDWSTLDDSLKLASIIVIGPGLGYTTEARKILEKMSSIDKPVVVDADALQVEFLNSLSTDLCVITPHPGEAARLLQSSAGEIQQDRMAALQQINNNWPYVAVLKGAGSLIGERNEIVKLCAHGHAGMATAGMGDVLSGLIAAFLAQGLSTLNATQSAVLVHALAAEYYAREHDAASLIASDVINYIALVVKDIRHISGI